MKTLKTILQEVISGIKAWVDTNTVHKTGTETIDGTKTFSAPQCYSSNAILFNSSVLPTQNTVPSANINPLRQYIGYGTSYANSIFIHDTEMRSNGRNHYRWTIYSSNHSDNVGMWLVYNPDSEYLKYLNLKCSCVPDANNTYHLGTPDYKWKTLNGINPGALSLPDTLGTSGTENVNYFNVIGYLNNTGTIATIPTTATYDGWLYINAKDGAGSYIIIDDSPSSFGTSVYGNNGLGSSSVGLLCLICPIRAGHSYNVRVKSAGIVSARIYPAQGNV